MGRLIQFEHCNSLHRSMDGQIQLLKSTEKDQVEQKVIRPYFVRWVLRLAPASWTQLAGEEQLGACLPHVFPRNISFIFRDTVRIGRDHEICVLHTAQPLSAGIKTVHMVCTVTY